MVLAKSFHEAASCHRHGQSTDTGLGPRLVGVRTDCGRGVDTGERVIKPADRAPWALKRNGRQMAGDPTNHEDQPKTFKVLQSRQGLVLSKPGRLNTPTI